MALLAFLVAGMVTPVGAEPLERAVVNALLNSDARKAAQAEITARQSDLGETQAGFGVTLEGYADIRMEARSGTDTLTAREAGITLSLPIYDGGRTAALVRRDAARVDEEIIRLIDETETLALNAVQAYIDLVRHSQVATLAEANIATHQRIRARVRAQIDGGRLPRSEDLRVADRLLLAQQVRLDAEQARADAVARFKRNIGYAPRGAVTLPRRIPAPASVKELVQVAVTNSARLAIVDSQISQLEDQRAADAAEYAPQVNLEGGVYAGADTDGVRGRDNGAFVGVGVDWTIYRGGAKAHRDAANRDRIQRSYYQRADQAREITELAERAWNAHRAALADRRLIAEQISTARRLVSTYLQEFDAGKRPLFDVLEAERILFNYRVQDINAHATEHFTLYKLLAVQTRLADHFGMAHAGRVLDPGYAAQARVNARGGFDISTPALDQ